MRGELRGNHPTILQLQEVLYQILHQPVLLRHVPLEVHHLIQHVLVVVLQVADVRRHLVLLPRHALELRLQGLDRARLRRRRVPRARVLARRGHFALDVLERVSPVGVEIGVAERPAL